MIRRPLRPSPRRAQVAKVVTVPAPIGGWNARDSLAAMNPTDAIVLDNFIPDTKGVRVRGSGVVFTIVNPLTRINALVETLFVYNYPNGNATLYAATASKIYNTNGTLVEVGALSNGRWQHSTITNTSGTYLYIVNGADTPRYYDGSNWTNTSFTGTGLTVANLIGVHTHMNRLWFIEKNTLNLWYGPTSAISGTLTKFIPPFRKGGHILACGSWTRDGGAGPDDHLVIVTNKGEVAVYVGTDPSSATTSALVGVFNIPTPIGRRCIVNAGSELGVLTQQGLIPLSTTVGLAASAAGRLAITDKISGAFRDAFRDYGEHYGWSITEWTAGNLLIVNVPVAEGTTFHQYVMNTHTGAWCRFTGLNAACWAVMKDSEGEHLVFADADEGEVAYYRTFNDVENAEVVWAFNDFRTPNVKRFTMGKLLFESEDVTVTDPEMAILLDYDTDTSNKYSDMSLTNARWQSINGAGSVGAPAIKLASLTHNDVDTSEFRIDSLDLMFEPGGPL